MPVTLHTKFWEMRVSASVGSLISYWKIGSTLPFFWLFKRSALAQLILFKSRNSWNSVRYVSWNSFYNKTFCLCFFFLFGRLWEDLLLHFCLYLHSFLIHFAELLCLALSPQWLENRLLITPWFVKFWAWGGTVSIRPLTVSNFGILHWHYLEWLE